MSTAVCRRLQPSQPWLTRAPPFVDARCPLGAHSVDAMAASSSWGQSPDISRGAAESPGIYTGGAAESAGGATVYHTGDPKTKEFVDKALCVGAVLGDGELNLFGPTQLQALMYLPLASGETVLEALPKFCKGCATPEAMSKALYDLVCTRFRVLFATTFRMQVPKCLHKIHGSTDTEQILKALQEASTLYHIEYMEQNKATGGAGEEEEVLAREARKFWQGRKRKFSAKSKRRVGTHFDVDAANPNDHGTVALLDEQFEKEPGFLAGFAFKAQGGRPAFEGGDRFLDAIDAFLVCATRLNNDRLYALLRLRNNDRPWGLPRKQVRNMLGSTDAWKRFQRERRAEVLGSEFDANPDVWDQIEKLSCARGKLDSELEPMNSWKRATLDAVTSMCGTGTRCWRIRSSIA